MATNNAVVLYEQTETSPEVVTIAGFLAGYSGRTREAYTLDLRQFLRWLDAHGLALFEVTRTHIEVYARQLEDEGKAPSTIGRRISTLAGFYRYAVEEGVIEPLRCTTSVRWPRSRLRFQAENASYRFAFRESCVSPSTPAATPSTAGPSHRSPFDVIDPLISRRSSWAARRPNAAVQTAARAVTRRWPRGGRMSM